MTISSQDKLIVFVGGAFCLLVFAYLVLRLFKRFCQNHGFDYNPFNFIISCCCCNRARRRDQNTIFGALSLERSRRRFESLITKQPELVVENLGSSLQVGETMTFKVTLPEARSFFSRSSSPIPPSVPISYPTPNAVQMSNNITIQVTKISGISERISFVQEFGLNQETNEEFISVKYNTREAGFYEIHVLYQNVHVSHSPHLLTFLSTEMDPGKTHLLRHAPSIVILTVSPHAMTIEPKDRFGNICRPENFNASDFSFKVTHMDESLKNQPLETIAYEFISAGTDQWGDTKCNIMLTFEVFIPGFFRGMIFHEDRPIGNGVFDLVCLTPDDNQILAETLKKSPDSVFHKAKLLIHNSEVQKNPSNVFIYVYQKTIIVKQYFFLNLLPYRLGFYRIVPATKIELLCANQENQDCTFTLRDRNQPKLTMEMNATNFRVFMAIFAHFLQQRLGGSESFENKQKFFHDELRSVREEKNRDFINIPVNRSNLIESSMTATRGFNVRDWCRKSKVQFEGEAGHDDGGLRREWLSLLCTKLFDNDSNGLFCSFGNSRLVHPNIHREKKWMLRHYEFAGKIVGKCLFESSLGGFHQQMVNGRFSRSFLAHLIGSFPQHKHFEQDDPELHLGKVKYILENDVTSMELFFQEEEYNKATGTLLKTVDLIPNGKEIQVTNENKEEYLAALAQFRLGTRAQTEIDAFLKGLNLIIPEGLLSNFDENELEILMCGKSTFVIEDLKRNHIVTDSGMNQTLVNKILHWFWNSIEGMSIEERGRLLQFTTGSSLLPNGGFKDLRPTFRITITNTTGHLPIAHTCFSEICLSAHNSFEEFNKSLRLAVNECSEGFAIL